ncbi:MAG TPA: hypothetical protein VK714_01880 [Myxococcota bacterium]|nr:hypothetical protein [Myxococcota bacterium]
MKAKPKGAKAGASQPSEALVRGEREAGEAALLAHDDAAKRRGAALSYFNAELGRVPKPDEVALLEEIGAIPRERPPGRARRDPRRSLALVVETLKRAREEGRREERAR